MDILSDDDLRTVIAGTNDLQEIIDGAKAVYHREKAQIDEDVERILHAG